MPIAVARVLLLALGAAAAPGWAQVAAQPAIRPAEPLAVQVAPAIQLERLRTENTRLRAENERLQAQNTRLQSDVAALRERLAALSARPQPGGNDGGLRETIAALERRVRDLIADNGRLAKDAADTRDRLAREADAAGDRLARSQAEAADLRRQLDAARQAPPPPVDTMAEDALRRDLQAAQDLQRQTQARVQTLEAADAQTRDRLAANDATIAQLQRERAGTGRPFWPWGAIAAAAALVAGAGLARALWPRAVRFAQPLSVQVRPGRWVPKALPPALAVAPGFGVRTELVPTGASLRAAHEPLVRKVRGAVAGAA